MLHRLCGPPSIHLSFNLAAVLPRRSTYRVNFATKCARHPTAGRHRLRRGLPGYLILFATHAFAPQCQCQSRRPPSPLVFLPISTHFTAPPGIPSAPTELKSTSFLCLPGVKPRSLTKNLINHLQTLYAQLIRITLASSVLPRLLAQS